MVSQLPETPFSFMARKFAIQNLIPIFDSVYVHVSLNDLFPREIEQYSMHGILHLVLVRITIKSN